MEKLEFECKTLSPLDGRYGKIKDAFADYFSEYGLVKYRVHVEIQWLVFLIKNIDTDVLNHFDHSHLSDIEAISKDFNYDAFKRIKEIENTTRHDVKAVEYYIDEKLREAGLDDLQSFVHIGCTSEDINNTSYGSMIRDGLRVSMIKSTLSFGIVISIGT